MSQQLPLIMEPEQLEQLLGEDNLLVVDMSRKSSYLEHHIPGAVHLECTSILANRRPVMGLVPSAMRLEEVLSNIGMSNDTTVVACDDEGGGKAGRLLWTLDLLGHRNRSLLNGGMCAWRAENRPLSSERASQPPGDYMARLGSKQLITRQELLESLDDPGMALLDTRSPAEFRGEDLRAARGGHIPGAVNLEWTRLMDPERNMRLKPEAELRAMLEPLGITPDKSVVVYCQTHHRSSLVYVALKALGYPSVKGYAGAWSEWGNDPDTPIET
ncbi:MAG TPA: sulfurtransferase [Gammaproteobacteria bacterium]|nr:sulfurtransferase [Gammaproteobacteria bacterium]